MNEYKFYQPNEVDYQKIVPAYRAAFAGDPWFEVTKCADNAQPKRCMGELSRLAMNMVCDVCLQQVTRPAYEADELIDRFKNLADTRQTVWYLEKLERQIALAAIAWKASAVVIAEEKYADVPPMQAWLKDTLGDEQVVWLDEVFADASVKPEGNLNNFKTMCQGMVQRLERPKVAYRSINPRMIRTAIRDFADCVTIPDAPDRRTLVIIDTEEQL